MYIVALHLVCEIYHGLRSEKFYWRWIQGCGAINAVDLHIKGCYFSMLFGYTVGHVAGRNHS